MTLSLYHLSPSRPGDFQRLPSIARIHYAAWMTIPLIRTTYHGGSGEVARKAIIQKYLDRDTNALQNERDCRLVVVLDDELEPESETGVLPRGRVIAAIKYYLVAGTGAHPDTDTQEIIDTPHPEARQSSYENVALSDVFVAALVEARKTTTAKLGAHVLIDNLYTDPAHHRRGAGGMLMREACRHADELGWPAMLEASPAGMKVYEAAGFTTTDWPGSEIWVDLQRWQDGGDKGQDFEDERLRRDPSRRDGWYVQMVMVRPARTRDDQERR